MASRNKYDGGRGRHRRGRGGYHSNLDDAGKKAKKAEAHVDESSPVIQVFRIFQQELDSRNDRHERIVKLSRDITIESKRLIFLLHRLTGLEDKEPVLAEAADKIKELHSTKFVALAKELHGQDPFQFLRAYSAGLQEYIEAMTFYHYLTSEKLVGIDRIQQDLTFSVTNAELENPSSQSAAGNHSVQSTTNKLDKLATSDTAAENHPTDLSSAQSNPTGNSDDVSRSCLGDSEGTQKITIPFPPSEYMLGVADFTGELMRMAINSVGAGDLDTPSVVSDMMRVINDAFVAFNNTPRELRQKTRVLRQSLQKVETACYTLKVRGSEIPKHMLAGVFSSAPSGPVDMEEEVELYD